VKGCDQAGGRAAHPSASRSRIPAGAPSGAVTARRRLPLPTLHPPHSTGLVYGLAAVDDRGRIADRAVVAALGWAPGTRLDIRERQGLLVIRRDAHGVFTVTKQGHPRLPAAVRHRCGLVVGDRVLLAADPHRDLLIVYPPAVLDAVLSRQHTELLDGPRGAPLGGDLT
jgi:bifunctional DNA-binding transcriptional regulator/antitoxin component of YhaV-PrlF toxin-antitoxin module